MVDAVITSKGRWTLRTADSSALRLSLARFEGLEYRHSLFCEATVRNPPKIARLRSTTHQTVSHQYADAFAAQRASRSTMLKPTSALSEIHQLIMTLPSPSQNVLHSNENHILLISIVLLPFPRFVACTARPLNLSLLSPRTTSTHPIQLCLPTRPPLAPRMAQPRGAIPSY
jgi:hypothetical protein